VINPPEPITAKPAVPVVVTGETVWTMLAVLLLVTVIGLVPVMLWNSSPAPVMAAPEEIVALIVSLYL
jgi:hypothetical protein